MAFYRGWLQGLPLRQMADTYLETGMDLRAAKSTLRWVQDEFRRVALRHGRLADSRLLRLRIAETHVVTGQPASAPSIEDFREEYDPAGFYTFDELMVHYLERYPKASNDTGRKRAALLERQIRALNWIEGLLVTEPRPEDAIEAWFDPHIVKRLASAGIVTLADLHARIAGRGYHWSRGISQLGEIRAVRITGWLGRYDKALGALPAYALVKPDAATPAMTRRPLTALAVIPAHPSAEPAPGEGGQLPAIVPLEAMLLPATRSVSPGDPDTGSIATGSGIAATDDRGAIESWLNAKSGSPATFRAYRKEAERLLLWAACERGSTFGGMTVEDCSAYRDWICSLGRVDDSAWPYTVPQEAWFAPRFTKRYSPDWRPFEGPLSPKSVNFALTVCRAMFRWLSTVRYLKFDPWPAVANPRAIADAAPEMELTHVFSREDWSALLSSIGTIEDEAHRQRAKLLARLGLVTGMRISELAGARYDRIYTRPLRDGRGTRWMLKVLGKGDKWRAVPLTADILQLMRESLRLRGLPDDPRNAPDDTAIVARLSDGEPLTSSGIAQIMQAIFAQAAAHARDDGDAERSRVFDRASTHWVRHTTGSFLGNAGAPPSQIQQLLGHASIATTTIYTSTGEDELFKTVEKVLTP